MTFTRLRLRIKPKFGAFPENLNFMFLMKMKHLELRDSLDHENRLINDCKVVKTPS